MRRATATVVAGSLLAVGAPAAWFLTAGPDTFGAEQAAALAAPTSIAAPAGSTAAGTGPTEPPASSDPGVLPANGLAISAPGVRSAALTSFDPPVQIRVAGLDAPVDEVGLTPEQDVEIPEDVQRTGWYSLGPAPGSTTGSAVIVGHVDDRDQGLGTFAVLPKVRPGDEVTVSTASGKQLGYDVVAMEEFDKEVVPLDRLFAVDGPPRLVLISCGGDFDSDTGNYTDNIVVTAVPRT